MPIGDLLAEISGGQPASAPSPKPTAPSGTKRKAEDGSSGATSTKLTKARQPDGSYATSKVTRDGEGRVVERSYSVSRPVKAAGPARAASMHSSTLPHRTSSPSRNGRYEPPAPTSQRTASASNTKLPASSTTTTQPKRPSESSSRSKLNQSTSATAKIAPSKPCPTTLTASNLSQAPKKGSFKEIMARGRKAQEVMGKVGMIQHKSTDKAPVKKEREATKPEQKSAMGSAAKVKMGTSYTGTGRTPAATGRDNRPTAASARATSRNSPSKDVKTGSKSKPAASGANDVVEKKVKKSATATTGYAGTARPRPGASAGKGPSRGDQRPRHGGLLAPPRMSRRNKYEDEYDEDLDDFIDYDDEEEDTGPRYYDSDGSSDMEAGLSDIDTEERRAEVYAREEDRREQALEERLKKEKEERKRQWQQGGR
ncbi:hypothetical protein F4803DRAFT_519694 [Xylaria telfairii]|nr:hypothetical protein F4803DRAFT_519694 [Xylaria telfairii]